MIPHCNSCSSNTLNSLEHLHYSSLDLTHHLFTFQDCARFKMYTASFAFFEALSVLVGSLEIASKPPHTLLAL